MSKHTPGPWEVVRDIGIKVHRSEPIPKGTRYAIAQIGVGRGDSQDEANARLIATAPDLLVALKRLVQVGCCAGEGVIEAEAAIAKADGRR